MSPLELLCWIYGTDTTVTFQVKIEPTETVSTLEEVIQCKSLVALGRIDLIRIRLYPVLIPDDKAFEAMLNGWNPEGKQYLTTRRRLSDLNLSGKLIIVHSPDLAMTIMCCVRGEDERTAFSVEIPPTKAVSALKRAIKNEIPVGFGHIDADRLFLYRVPDEIPDVDEAMRMIDLNKPLLAEVPLARYFSTPPPEGRIHIMVDAHSQVVPQKRSLESESDVFSPKRVELERQKFLNDSKSCSPSLQGANPATFLSRQKNPRTAIYCGRPRTTAATIPVTLLHSSFGQFISDCMTLEVTHEDEAFAMQLSTRMSDIYSNEDVRARAIRNVFFTNGFCFMNLVADCTTDGAISVDDGPHLCVISEFKNEVGGTGPDPYFEAILHYLERTRDLALNADPLPCILLLVFGPWITFAGAVWNLRPTVQILSDALSTHYHPTNTWAQAELARHLGAFKKAVQNLKEHYRNPSRVPNPPSLQPQLFPYPTSFTCLQDRSIRKFKYTSQPFPDKLVFFGEITTPEGQSPICIKFVRRYSKEVHERCSALEHAPALHGYEELPGGWWMVVMQQMLASTHQWLHNIIDPSKELLRDMEAFVKKLHEDGYVHGDIRDANFMVSKNNKSDFVLLDFDWAGKIGEVRYPIDLNTTSVWRPPGARGGAIIEVEHDIQMLGSIREPGSHPPSFLLAGAVWF